MLLSLQLHTSRTCDANITERRLIGYLLTPNELSILEGWSTWVDLIQLQSNQRVRLLLPIRESKQAEMRTAIPQMWTSVDLLCNTSARAGARGYRPAGPLAAVCPRPRRWRDG